MESPPADVVSTPADRKEIGHIWKRKQSSLENGENDTKYLIYSAMSSVEEVNQWLMVSERILEDDVINLKLSDIQCLVEKRKRLEDLYDEIISFVPQIESISAIVQTFCQSIPPSEQRTEKKVAISQTRVRMIKLRLKVVEQREKFRMLVPLLCSYNEHLLKIRPWLDEAEDKTRIFIDKQDDEISLLENASPIEAVLANMLEMRPVYEAYLTYGETALDTAIIPFDDLKNELEEIIMRWDSLCGKLDKCWGGLQTARKNEEENLKNEAQRIESQLRREAHRCSCRKPFQIIRIGEGKYTFGNSKIVRLVRVHGQSVVVRVGGGWQFLFDFLVKYDPCRAKELAEDGIENFRKLSMKAIDERRHSFAFETRKLYTSGAHSLSRTHSLSQRDMINSLEEVLHRDGANLCSSFDSLDGASLGSDAGNTCNEKSCQRKRTPTPTKGMPKRKMSASSLPRNQDTNGFQKNPDTALSPLARPKSATPGSANRPARKSLVERQSDYSELRKGSGLQRTSSPRVRTG